MALTVKTRVSAGRSVAREQKLTKASKNPQNMAFHTPGPFFWIGCVVVKGAGKSNSTRRAG
jgi:hypothetical protein